MINTILIYGNLGSGKTTLIQKLLQEEDYKNSFIIENEFAHENIDQKTINSPSVVPISGFCVCCSNGDELHQALQKVKEENKNKFPLIIETTGVASGREVIKKLFLDSFFQENFKLVSTIYVLDALETSDNPNLEDALIADCVYMSKTDMADAHKVSALSSLLHKNNLSTTLTLENSQSFLKLPSTKSAKHPDQAYFALKLQKAYNTNSLREKIQDLYKTTTLCKQPPTT